MRLIRPHQRRSRSNKIRLPSTQSSRIRTRRLQARSSRKQIPRSPRTILKMSRLCVRTEMMKWPLRLRKTIYLTMQTYLAMKMKTRSDSYKLVMCQLWSKSQSSAMQPRNTLTHRRKQASLSQPHSHLSSKDMKRLSRHSKSNP